VSTIPAPGTVHVIRDDAEAIAAAHAFAAEIAPTASDRDRSGEPPFAELERFAQTGLLAIQVPKQYGGAGVSNETLVEVYRIIAVADPAIAQVPQNHVQFMDATKRFTSEAQRARYCAEILAGGRFGNALSERGGVTPLDIRSTIKRDANGVLRLNGTKFYSTGALTASTIPAVAVNDEGTFTCAFIPRDTPGVEPKQDWTAFGQRATISGSVVFTDVAVDDEWVIRDFPMPATEKLTFHATHQAIHVAIDVGIARAALEDAKRYVLERARPFFETGLTRAADDPFVIQQIGRMTVRVEACEALLAKAARLLDEAERLGTEQSIDEARVGVAGAKAYACEIALEVATDIFELTGTSAADRSHNLDRHWRNARVHTLHDANRIKYQYVGNYRLNGIGPAAEALLV
jgi:SfnB family sulfur acquisition oxidoreductase